MSEQACICTVNLATGEVKDRDNGCPVHGDGTGHYVVNVSKGEVYGPYSYKVAKEMIDLDLAEWATRDKADAQIRHSRLVEVTVGWGPRSDEDYQQQTVITEVSLDAPPWPPVKQRRPPAKVTISSLPVNQYTYQGKPGGISVRGLMDHYSVRPAQACLEVAAHLLVRHERAQQDTKAGAQ